MSRSGQRQQVAAATRRTALTIATALVLLAACGGGESDDTSATIAVPTSTDPAPTEPAEPVVPECVAPASLEDRAGAVLMAGLEQTTSIDDPLVDDLADVGVGGVLVSRDNLIDRDQTSQLITGLRDRFQRTVLVAVDEEGGRVSKLGGVAESLPSARRMGQLPPSEITAAAAGLGASLHELGIDLMLAPVGDVDDGPAGGIIGDRSYSGDPALAAASSVAFVEGLHEAGMSATAKHFPGHGRATDSHDGEAVVDVSLDELRTVELVPFRALFDAGVDSVMMGHVTYPSVGPLPASLEPGAYELLRETSFEGAAITDALGMGAIINRWGFADAAATAVIAGADIVLANQGQQAATMRDGIVAAVRDGRLPEERLDEAVARSLVLQGTDPATMVCPPAAPEQ